MASTTATPAMTHFAIGTRSGMSSRSKEPASSSARARPGNGPPTEPAGAATHARRALRLALGLGQAVRHLAEPARLLGIGRGRQAPGEPQVEQQHDQRDDQGAEEQADLDADAGPEDAVEADALVPDRVGPEVDAGAGQEDDEGDHDDGDHEAHAAQDRPQGQASGAVVGTTHGLLRAWRAGRAARRGALGARPGAAVDRGRLTGPGRGAFVGRVAGGPVARAVVGRVLRCRAHRRRRRGPPGPPDRGGACALRPRRGGAPAPA